MAEQYFSWSSDRGSWPKGPSTLVFLGDAFHDVGSHLYGDEWTGREALEPLTPIADQKRAVDSLFRAANSPPPALSIRTQRPAPRSETPKFILPTRTPEQIAEYERKRDAAIEAEAEAADASRMRRRKVAEWIAQRGRDNDLHAFGIWVRGGVAPLPVEAHHWNGTDDWRLLQQCVVEVTSWSPAYVIVPYFIFLTRESLGQQIERDRANVNPASLEDSDAPLVEEMEAARRSSSAKSRHAAALRIVGRAGGGGTTESKVRRLTDRHKEKYPGRW